MNTFDMTRNVLNYDCFNSYEGTRWVEFDVYSPDRNVNGGYNYIGTPLSLEIGVDYESYEESQ